MRAPGTYSRAAAVEADDDMYAIMLALMTEAEQDS